MRIFKTAWFQHFAKREKLSDAMLREAVRQMERGLIDADLGGGVIKQRIARPGQGKSSGYRSVIAFRQEDRAFFIFGFSKSARSNLREDDLAVYKKAAKALLALSDQQIQRLIDVQALTEVV